MASIPTRSRNLVRARDRFLCVRCGCTGRHWHHRRSRAVHDEHEHCTCNGVWLCASCHSWVHTNPFLARTEGLIVSRYQEPASVAMRTVYGQVLPDCDGGFVYLDDRR